MTPSSAGFLSKHDQLVVQQTKEWAEILVNWETRNRYQLLDAHAGTVGFIAERAGGFWDTIKRLVLRSHRSVRADVFAPEGTPLLQLFRPFFWFFSAITVTTSDGSRLGSVHRTFNLFYKDYELKDENEAAFARIRSPIWRLWTFSILSPGGQRLGQISKRWGGALKELFTDADNYLIDFGGGDWTETQRAVILAAAITIDFDFFEENSRAVFRHSS